MESLGTNRMCRESGVPTMHELDCFADTRAGEISGGTWNLPPARPQIPHSYVPSPSAREEWARSDRCLMAALYLTSPRITHEILGNLDLRGRMRAVVSPVHQLVTDEKYRNILVDRRLVLSQHSRVSVNALNRMSYDTALPASSSLGQLFHGSS
jgi:hypothetical protein